MYRFCAHRKDISASSACLFLSLCLCLCFFSFTTRKAWKARQSLTSPHTWYSKRLNDIQYWYTYIYIYWYIYIYIFFFLVQLFGSKFCTGVDKSQASKPRGGAATNRADCTGLAFSDFLPGGWCMTFASCMVWGQGKMRQDMATWAKYSITGTTETKGTKETYAGNLGNSAPHSGRSSWILGTRRGSRTTQRRGRGE